MVLDVALGILLALAILAAGGGLLLWLLHLPEHRAARRLAEERAKAYAEQRAAEEAARQRDS